jgi:hypothetical protein
MLVRLTPALRNHALKVAPVSGLGNPEAKPSANIAATRQLR